MSESPSNTPATRFRWTICFLVFCATTINCIDRQILGILAPTLEKEISWIVISESRIKYSEIPTGYSLRKA